MLSSYICIETFIIKYVYVLSLKENGQKPESIKIIHSPFNRPQLQHTELRTT